MNVGAYNTSGNQEQLDFLSAKVVGKSANGKILAVRQVKTPKFHGLFLDVKVGANKYAYGVSFDRFDLGAIIAQVGSEETDDWLGQSVKFVTKKGKKKGQTFINVAYPKRKK